MNVLEKLLKSNINVYGEEHLRDQPTLYVVNHFTRFETFILPYVLNKTTGRHIHSLAHDSLFKGAVGNYLRKLGAVSTGHPMRNRLIIGNLMRGDFDWVIYPEGIMMKNKRVTRRGRGYQMTTPAGKVSPHTGAAVLALKAQFARNEYRTAVEQGNAERIKDIGERYGITGLGDLSDRDVIISPVTITYYPIRPGRNLIKRIVMRLVRGLSDRAQEELEIEGNLLLNDTDISITIGHPLDVSDYMGHIPTSKRIMRMIVGDKRMSDAQVWMRKGRLTRDFMRQIYRNVRINLDHIICSGFRNLESDSVCEKDYRKAIYLAARHVGDSGSFHVHRSLSEELIGLVADEPCEAADDLFELAVEEQVLRRENGTLHINRERLIDTHDFHEIRLKNTVRILANELEPAQDATRVISSLVNQTSEVLDHRVVRTLIERDLDLFETEYEAFYDAELSKDRDVGLPRLLKGSAGYPGVVLSHGYLSSPAEVSGLAHYLNDIGYSVYMVRMQGHGTSPRNLAEVEWEQWYASYLRGYAILRHSCDEVVLGGFSTGGILALLKAANPGACVAGAFSINAPLSLMNLKTRFVPAVAKWNELLERFRMDRGQYEEMEHVPENATTNYTKNYVSSLYQLDLMMDACEAVLPKIEIPLLIIQGKDDPAVVPESASQIAAAVSSTDCQLDVMDFDRHCILSGEGHEQVYSRVADFLAGLKAE